MLPGTNRPGMLAIARGWTQQKAVCKRRTCACVALLGLSLAIRAQLHAAPNPKLSWSGFVLEGSATTGCVHAQNVSARSREFLLLAQGVGCGGKCLVEGLLGQRFAPPSHPYLWLFNEDMAYFLVFFSSAVSASAVACSLWVLSALCLPDTLCAELRETHCCQDRGNLWATCPICISIWILVTV